MAFPPAPVAPRGVRRLNSPGRFRPPPPALPEDIQWLTNEADPVFASPEARRGGTFHTAIMSFPLTFRTVGPDSNSSFRSAILGNQLSLIGLHPNTLNITPGAGHPLGL